MSMFAQLLTGAIKPPPPPSERYVRTVSIDRHDHERAGLDPTDAACVTGQALKGLATRARIAAFIRGQSSATCHEVMEALSLSDSCVKHHLAIMLSNGEVRKRRDGVTVLWIDAGIVDGLLPPSAPGRGGNNSNSHAARRRNYLRRYRDAFGGEDATAGTLADRLGVANATVQIQMRRLEREGIVMEAGRAPKAVGGNPSIIWRWIGPTTDAEQQAGARQREAA